MQSTEQDWGFAPSELVAKSLLEEQRPGYVIEGVLPRARVVGLSGMSGIGMSLVALDWAAAVAAGEDWHGHAVPERLPVAYLVDTGFEHLGRRISAWEGLHGAEMDDGVTFLRGGSRNMLRGWDLTDGDAVGSLLEQLGKRMPGLVVLDTKLLSTDAPGVIDLAEAIISHTGATVLLVNHWQSRMDTGASWPADYLGGLDSLVRLVSRTSGARTSFTMTTEEMEGAKPFSQTELSLGGFFVDATGALDRRRPAPGLAS